MGDNRCISPLQKLKFSFFTIFNIFKTISWVSTEVYKERKKIDQSFSLQTLLLIIVLINKIYQFIRTSSNSNRYELSERIAFCVKILNYLSMTTSQITATTIDLSNYVIY